MKRNLALMLAITLLSFAVSALADNGPAEVKFENKRGTVTFNHLQHQGINDCATCHHKGMDIPACRSCHDGATAPAAKTVFHNLCKECHKKSQTEQVKGDCAECHKK